MAARQAGKLRSQPKPAGDRQKDDMNLNMDKENSAESGVHGVSASDDSAEIEELRKRIQALQSDFANADRRLRVAVRQRPLVAIGAAIAAGFVLGRIIGRS